MTAILTAQDVAMFNEQPMELLDAVEAGLMVEHNAQAAREAALRHALELLGIKEDEYDDAERDIGNAFVRAMFDYQHLDDGHLAPTDLQNTVHKMADEAARIGDALEAAAAASERLGALDAQLFANLFAAGADPGPRSQQMHETMAKVVKSFATQVNAYVPGLTLDPAELEKNLPKADREVNREVVQLSVKRPMNGLWSVWATKLRQIAQDINLERARSTRRVANEMQRDLIWLLAVVYEKYRPGHPANAERKPSEIRGSDKDGPSRFVRFVQAAWLWAGERTVNVPMPKPEQIKGALDARKSAEVR